MVGSKEVIGKASSICEEIGVKGKKNEIQNINSKNLLFKSL